MPRCETKIKSVKDSFAPRLAKLQEESKELEDQGKQVSASGTVKVDFVRKDFSFNSLEMTMRDRKISFNTPQVTMKNNKISFKVPVITMQNKVVGRKPNVKCRGFKCKIYWTDIKTKVPVSTMELKEIVTKIPEFRYDTTSFITKVPEFTSKRRDFSFNYPKINITVDSWAINAPLPQDIDKQSEKLANEGEALQAEMQAATVPVVVEGLECNRNDLQTKRSQSSEEFLKAIKELDDNIKTIQALGANPSLIKDESGNDINLFKLKEDLLAEYSNAMKEFDTAIEEINKNLEQTTRAIVPESATI